MQTTLGIDLASQSAKTALCVIAWEGGRAEVRTVARSSWQGTPIHDKLLSTAAQGLWGSGFADGWGDAGRPAKVAIDAPFGWPEPFVDAVSAHHRLEGWPALIDEKRAPFERRETDRFVYAQTGKLPLSVSTDRIAYPAMRCAVILNDLAQRLGSDAVARDGTGLVAEAYPDAALRQWLPELWATATPDSYKAAGEPARRRRQMLLQALQDGLGPAFLIGAEQHEACVLTDDGLDALVCALVARAVERGRTLPPQSAEQQRLARSEGWIHLPQPGSLADLL